MSNPFKLSAIDSYLGSSKSIRFNPEITSAPRRHAEIGGLTQRITAQNKELPPKQFDNEPKGSTYLNGRGYSEYGAFPPYLA